MGNIVKILTSFVMIIFLLWSNPATTIGNGLCEGSGATLECLKKNSYELYSTNPTLFWKILNQAADKAFRCDEPSDTIRFLELVQMTLDGALYEFYSEKIENLCIAKPKCFLDAMTSLKKEEQAANIKMLRVPLVSDPKEIRRIFENNKKTVKYKRVVDLYFK
jgi:hypothetical protein